jgi:hypothetical protein
MIGFKCQWYFSFWLVVVKIIDGVNSNRLVPELGEYYPIAKSRCEPLLGVRRRLFAELNRHVTKLMGERKRS